MASRSEKEKKRPLPVIDLGQLLGYSNVRLKTSSVTDKEKSTANAREKSVKASSMEQEENQENDGATVAARLSHLHRRNKEPEHPGATAQQARGSTGLSFYESLLVGPFLPSQDAGNAGTVNDTSLAVAKPASNPPMASPRALPVLHGYETLFLQGQQTGAQLHGFTNSMSTKSHAIVLNGGIEAQQQTRAVTPEQQVAIDSTAGKVVDTKEDQVGDTKAGKVESASINTQQAMPNRNICTPLDPVPSVYSR